MAQHATLVGVAWHLPVQLFGITHDTLAHPEVKNHLVKVILQSWQRATLIGNVHKTRKIQALMAYRYWHLWIENLETALNSAMLQTHLKLSVSWAQAELMMRALTAMWQVARQRVHIDGLGRIVMMNHAEVVSRRYLARWLYILVARLEKVETIRWHAHTALTQAAFGEWVESYCLSMKSRRLCDYINQSRCSEYLRSWRECVYETKLAAIQNYVRPLSCVRRWKRSALWKHNGQKLTKISQKRMFLKPAFCLWRQKCTLSRQTRAVTSLVAHNRVSMAMKKWRTQCKLRTRLADAAFNAWAASDQATGVFSLKLEQIMRRSVLRRALQRMKLADSRLKRYFDELSDIVCKASRAKTIFVWHDAFCAIKRRSALGECLHTCLRLRRPESIMQSELLTVQLKSQSLKGFVMRSSLRKLAVMSALFSDWLDMSRTRRKYKAQLLHLRKLLAARHIARYFACWKQTHDSSKSGQFCLHVRSLIFLQDVLRQWHQWSLSQRSDREDRASQLSSYIQARRVSQALTLWAINYTDNVRLRNNAGELRAYTTRQNLTLYFALWRRAYLHKICLLNIKSNLSTKMEAKILSQTFEIWARQFATHVTIRHQFGLFFEVRKKDSLLFVWRQFINVTKLENLGSEIFNRRLTSKALKALRSTAIACKRNAKLAEILRTQIYFKSAEWRYFDIWRRAAAVKIAIRIRGDAIANSRFEATCQRWLHYWYQSADRWVRIRHSLEGANNYHLVDSEDLSFSADNTRHHNELTELDTYNLSESSAELSRWPTMTEHYIHGLTEVEPTQTESQFYSFNTTATSAYSQQREPFVSKEHLIRILNHCVPDPRGGGSDLLKQRTESRLPSYLSAIMKRKAEVLNYNISRKEGGKHEECSIHESARYIFASKSDWICSFYLKKALFERRLIRVLCVGAYSPQSRSSCNPIRLTRLSNQYRVKLLRPWFANWRARANQTREWAYSNITVNVMLKKYLNCMQGAWKNTLKRRSERTRAFYNTLRLTLARQCVSHLKDHGFRYVKHLTKRSLMRVCRVRSIWHTWKSVWLSGVTLRKMDRWILKKSIQQCLDFPCANQNIGLKSLLDRWRKDQKRIYLKMSIAASTLSKVIFQSSFNTLRINLFFKRWLKAHVCSIQTTSMLENKEQQIIARRVVRAWRRNRLIVRIVHRRTQKYFEAFKASWRDRQWSNHIQKSLVRNRLRLCMLNWSARITREKYSLQKLVRAGTEITLASGWRHLMRFVEKLNNQRADCEVCSRFWRGSRVLKIWISKARVARGTRRLDRVIQKSAEARLTVTAFRALRERNTRYKVNRLITALGKIKLKPSPNLNVKKFFSHWRYLTFESFRGCPQTRQPEYSKLANYWYKCLLTKLNYKDIDGRILLSDCIRSWLQLSLRNLSLRARKRERSALCLSRWRVCTVDRLYKGRKCVDQCKLTRMKNSLLCWQLATQIVRYELSAASLALRKLQQLEFAEVLIAFKTHSVVSIWWREISKLTQRWQARCAMHNVRSAIKAWYRVAQMGRVSTFVLTHRFVRLEKKCFDVWRLAARKNHEESLSITPIESPEHNGLIELSLPCLPELRSNAARNALKFMDNDPTTLTDDVEQVDEEQLRLLGFTKASEDSNDWGGYNPGKQTKELVSTEFSSQTVALRPATNAWILKQARLRQVWLKWRVAFHKKKRRLNASLSSIGERSLVVADEWSPAPTPALRSIRHFLDKELDELEQMRSPPSFA